MRFFRIFLAGFLLFSGFLSIVPEDNPAAKKLSAKVERIIINQVLKELQESDYESYLLLSAMWQGIKNQSRASIERSLKQLLVEKGFIYTLNSRGYRYTEPGMAYTLFAREFFTGMKAENPEYLRMVMYRYKYMIAASLIANDYFLPDSYFSIRTLLNDVVYEVEKAGKGGDRAELMTEYLLRTNYIPFRNRMEMQDPAKRARFTAALKEYLGYNDAQFAAYEKMDAGGVHEKISAGLEKRIASYRYKKWIDDYSSQEEMKEIYLEMISYIVRVTLSGDMEFATSARAGRFRTFRKVLLKMNPDLRIKGDTLGAIRAGLLENLRKEMTGDEVRYTALAAMYTLTNSLVEHGRISVRLYQENGSLLDMISLSRGRYFKRHLVVPWYRDFYREGWFGNVFLAEDDRYPEFFTAIQLTALMTDYIIRRDDKRLVRNFLRFSWNKMRETGATRRAFAEKLKESMEQSLKEGMTRGETELVEATFDQMMGTRSLSDLILIMKKYSAATGKRNAAWLPEFGEKLDRGPFAATPYLQAYYLKIAEVLSGKAEIADLRPVLERLEPDVIREALAWRGGAFSWMSTRFDFELPAQGITIRSILQLLAEQDQTSFRSTLLTTYNQSLDSSLEAMPKKSKAVSEPFIRSAMDSLVVGNRISLEEYTNVALQSMKGFERGNLWLHMSLGFAVGNFRSITGNQTANKVFLSDMIGVDFIGLGYHLSDSLKTPVVGLGIFAGGLLDYMVSEAAKLETRTLPGGSNYLKTGLFLNFRHPDNSLIHFGIQAGAAFDLTGTPVYYIAGTWNLFEISDFL